MLYESSDGAQSWALVQADVPLGRVNSMLFGDVQHGMVTLPRNSTWSLDTPGFADQWALQIAITSDGGHHWTVLQPQT